MNQVWPHWEKLAQLLSSELEGSKYVAEFKSAGKSDWIEFVQYHNGIRVRKASLAFTHADSENTMDLTGRKWNGKKFIAAKLCRLNAAQLDDEGLEEIAQEVASVVRDIEPNS